MNIKCIALDLDRTTLNAHGHLSEGNYNALCNAIENGVHIVIASGRSFDTLPKDVLAVPELNMLLLPMVLLFIIFLQKHVFMNIR